jgi:hypothetical protein
MLIQDAEHYQVLLSFLACTVLEARLLKKW